MAVKILGPKSRAGLTANEVSMPSDVLMPNNVMKSARGTSPAGGGPFFLSVTAMITMSKIAVPMNSEKKDETDVMYGSCKFINKSIKRWGSALNV
jgi:hypothetical protein